MDSWPGIIDTIRVNKTRHGTLIQVLPVAQATKWPLDITIVCDRSQSMQGPKHDLLVKTLQMLQVNVPTHSRLSLVAFNATAHVHVTLQALKDLDIEKLAAKALQPKGVTNLGEGLLLGLSIAEHGIRQQKGTQGLDDDLIYRNNVPIVLAFTDGRVNRGKQSYQLVDWFANQTQLSSPELEVWLCALGDDADHELIHAMGNRSRNVEINHISDSDLEAFSAAIGNMVHVYTSSQRVYVHYLEQEDVKEENQVKNWTAFKSKFITPGSRSTLFFLPTGPTSDVLNLRVSTKGKEAEMKVAVTTNENFARLAQLVAFNDEVAHVVASSCHSVQGLRNLLAQSQLITSESPKSGGPENNFEVEELEFIVLQQIIQQMETVSQLISTEGQDSIALLRSQSQSAQALRQVSTQASQEEAQAYRLFVSQPESPKPSTILDRYPQMEVVPPAVSALDDFGLSGEVTDYDHLVDSDVQLEKPKTKTFFLSAGHSNSIRALLKHPTQAISKLQHHKANHFMTYSLSHDGWFEVEKTGPQRLDLIDKRRKLTGMTPCSTWLKLASTNF